MLGTVTGPAVEGLDRLQERTSSGAATENRMRGQRPSMTPSCLRGNSQAVATVASGVRLFCRDASPVGSYQIHLGT